MYNLIVNVVQRNERKREENEEERETTRWCTLFDRTSSVGGLFRREVSMDHSFIGKLVRATHEQIIFGLQGTTESFFEPSLRLEGQGHRR